MPELAEVEFFRKRWSAGIGGRVDRVHVHGTKRIFRGEAVEKLPAVLTDAVLVDSERKAKQMLFRLSTATLGIHLGMTGELLVAGADFVPGKHDHLVIYQRERALIFRDPRLFGRVRFTLGTDDPAWWKVLPEELTARSFTKARLREVLQRRGKAPLKAVLLMQEFFPGIGNWMADEILWRGGLLPDRRSGTLTELEIARLYREIREVVKISLKTIGNSTGETFGEPPRGWLFHERWPAKGCCPKHGVTLNTATVGGRTTRWCGICQPICKLL